MADKPQPEKIKKQAEHVFRRYDDLKQDRSYYEDEWQDCVDYVLPTRGRIATWTQRNETADLRLFNSTPIRACDLYASTLVGQIINPATQWLALELNNKILNQIPGVKENLDERERILLDEFGESNFYEQSHEMFLDYIALGTGVMYIQKGLNSALTFSTRHLDEIVIGADGDGQIDTVMRKFKLSARAAAQLYEQKKLPEVIQKQLKESPDEKSEYMQACFPREDRNPKVKNAQNKPFASLTYHFDTKTLIEDSGYDEFPYATPRYSVISGETWGRGPAQIALPDIRMINAMTATVINSSEKLVDPPLFLQEDDSNQDVDIRAGSVNFVRDPSKIREIPGGRPDFGMDAIAAIEQRIELMFLMDRLQSISEIQRTATEVIEMSEQRFLTLGPVLVRTRKEYLTIVINRSYGILDRAGKFPEWPDELYEAADQLELDLVAESGIRSRFISPIARAQRSQEAQAILRFMEFLAKASEFDQGAFDIMKPQEAYRFIGEKWNVPNMILNTTDEVGQIQDDRQKAQEEAQANQDELQAAEIAKQGVDSVAKVVQAEGGAQ